MRTELAINGAAYVVDVDTRTTLLDALRDHLGLTGSKKGCDHGQCAHALRDLDLRRFGLRTGTDCRLSQHR
jgi:xanthine dehydrogenase YagT iron-sulfur-binding subunit